MHFVSYMNAIIVIVTSLVAQMVKNPLQCGRPGFDPWVGKIHWRGGHGNPLQYSCRKNPMERGAW